jgi:hypothetical protein
VGRIKGRCTAHSVCGRNGSEGDVPGDGIAASECLPAGYRGPRTEIDRFCSDTVRQRFCRRGC